MNDQQAAAILARIDGPRPLPADLESTLVDELTSPVARLGVGDQSRALPEDLRRRLAASLAASTATPVPATLRRRIERATTRRPVLQRVAAAAAGLLLIAGLAGLLVTGDDAPLDVAGPATTSRPGADTTSLHPLPGAGASVGDADGSTAGGPPVGTGGHGPEAPPFTDGAASDAVPGGAPAGAATAGQTPLRVAVAGSATDVDLGFRAYIDVLNASGGVRGRQVELVGASAPDVAVGVNVAEGAMRSSPPGVWFETVHVEDQRLRRGIVAMVSAIERQARLAAATAFPTDGGGRAIVYAGRSEPWLTVVPDAIEVVLRARGVTVVRIPFDGAIAPVTGDAAFLSLAPTDVAAWLDAFSGSPPPRGTWGVASAWLDEHAAAASAAGLRVLSPYRPAGSEETRSLTEALGDRSLSAGAVHGWVTGKAVAHLLFENGGTTVTEGDLDRLIGWDLGWAPPFEVRAGTRSRTPDAVLLVPTDAGFVADGAFLRDD